MLSEASSATIIRRAFPVFTAFSAANSPLAILPARSANPKRDITLSFNLLQLLFQIIVALLRNLCFLKLVQELFSFWPAQDRPYYCIYMHLVHFSCQSDQIQSLPFQDPHSVSKRYGFSSFLLFSMLAFSSSSDIDSYLGFFALLNFFNLLLFCK